MFRYVRLVYYWMKKLILSSFFEWCSFGVILAVSLWHTVFPRRVNPGNFGARQILEILISMYASNINIMIQLNDSTRMPSTRVGKARRDANHTRMLLVQRCWTRRSETIDAIFCIERACSTRLWRVEEFGWGVLFGGVLCQYGLPSGARHWRCSYKQRSWVAYQAVATANENDKMKHTTRKSESAGLANCMEVKISGLLMPEIPKPLYRIFMVSAPTCWLGTWWKEIFINNFLCIGFRDRDNHWRFCQCHTPRVWSQRPSFQRKQCLPDDNQYQLSRNRAGASITASLLSGCCTYDPSESDRSHKFRRAHSTEIRSSMVVTVWSNLGSFVKSWSQPAFRKRRSVQEWGMRHDS